VIRFELPSTPYLPGSGTEPDRSALEPLKALCPARVTDENWTGNIAYLAGLELYQAGYFWEAHEVLEPFWMSCAPNSRERHLVAGLIQLANTCLKLRMCRPRAASRLSEMVIDHLAEASSGGGPILMGLDCKGLLEETRAWRSRMPAAVTARLPAGQLLAHRPVLELVEYR
jgi:hypothetical protein